MSPTKETFVAALNEVPDLPTLPRVVAHLEALLRQETTTAEGIAEIISTDPTISANILRVVNSAYYAARTGRITSLRHAVARLGLREVDRICTVLSVVETFRGMGPHLDHEVFWRHSLMAGIASRIIHRLGQRSPSIGEDEAYLAGLLHDIGILILDQYFPSLYERSRKEAAQSSLSCPQEERRLLGMDHGEIGALILNRWNMSPAMVQAVAWHHQPSRCDAQYRGLVCTVHLADSICIELGIGDFSDGGISGIGEDIWNDLRLSADHIPAIIEHLRKEESECESFLSL